MQAGKMTRFLDRAAVRTTLAAAVVALLALYALLLSLDPTRANHDVGWTIYAGGQLLDGARFGVDLIDNNPPLIYWTSAVVNAVARTIGAPVFPVYNISVLVLILACAFVSWRLLADAVPVREVRDSLGLAIAAAPVLIAGYGFAQRDQMIAALLVPYVLGAGLAAVGKAPSRMLRVVIGVGLGLALLLKPHYVLAWLAVELVVAVRERRLTAWSRLENWTMAGIGSTYLAAVFLAAPGYLETVRDTLAVYHAYDKPVPWLSAETAITALALFVVAVAKPRSALGACSAAAIGAALAGLVVVILQKKGFHYHYIPMLTMAFMAAALTLSDRLIRAEEEVKPGAAAGRQRLFAMTTLAIVLALLGTWTARGRFQDRGELTAVIAEHGGGRPVLYFSSSVDPLFPSLVFTESPSASPYSCLWFIAGNYSPEELRQRPFPYRSLGEMGRLERQFVTTIVDALERQAPSLLFFDRRAGKQSFGFTAFEFERYFAADPRFVRLMQQYRQMGLVGTAMTYRRASGADEAQEKE